MSVKKIIKLVNNERTNSKLTSLKACGADATSIDTCVSLDNADCTNYALDRCTKDYAGCYNGADDTCYQDTDACGGPGAEDND